MNMTRITTTVLLVVASVTLLGCGATTGTSARSTISTFDGARIVSIDAHSTNCNMSMVCSLLGATWTSSVPTKAMLGVEVMADYTSIQSAYLNIDGRIVHLDVSEPITHFDQVLPQPSGALYSPGLAELGRRSSKGFMVPLDLVRSILAAKDVRLRVATTDVTIDSVVFTADKDSKAHHALERFIVQVDHPTGR